MPARLNTLMAVLYPTSLGVDEALADLCVRAYSSMLATGPAAFGTWVLYFKVVLGTGAGVLSAIFYMPIVYRRYETTVALPIEYGALNMCTVLSGMIFYKEHEVMEGWQLGLQLAGAAIIVVGIGVGRIPATRGAGAGAEQSAAIKKAQEA